MVENARTPSNWLELPLEIWVKISKHLSKHDVFFLACTNHKFRRLLLSDPIWWPKIRMSSYMCDYDPVTLTYKKKLRAGESCFDYFKRKKEDDRFVKILISDIINYDPANEDPDFEVSINQRLDMVYTNFDSYVSALLNESLHLTTSLFRSKDGFVLADDFIRLQKKRNLKLSEIYVASKILECGKAFRCIMFYKSLLLNHIPDDLETVLLHLSLLDSRYYELIMQRHKVLKATCHYYQSYIFDESAKPAEKILTLVTILHRVIDARKRRILRYEQNASKTTIEDLSVLRFYCGDGNGTPLLKNAIVQKLANMVGLGEYIEINEWCIRIKDRSDYLYLLIDENQMYLKREHEVPEVIRHFPMQNPDLLIVKQSNMDDFQSDSRKYLYISKFLNFFNGFQSRVDDLKGADQIIYQMHGEERIVTMHRGDYIQAQILCCGGYVDCSIWRDMRYLILEKSPKFEDLSKNLSIFNKPLFEILGLVNIPYNFQTLFFRELSITPIIGREIDILWECEQLRIGDVVWSDASQARGVIVEISDSISEEDLSQPNGNTKRMGLLSCTTYRKKIRKLNGVPLYTIFFGAYGFATFSRQYLKRDQSDRVEGLLAYDLIGKWFSHYDYDTLHMFVYRHDNIFV